MNIYDWKTLQFKKKYCKISAITTFILPQKVYVRT